MEFDVSEKPEDDKQSLSSDDKDDEVGSSDDDTFGDKFEIPAFLRKIH